MTDNTRIKSTELAEKGPAGVPEGTVEKTDQSIPEPVRDRIEHEEVVVYERDKDGNVAGFHKEAAKASK